MKKKPFFSVVIPVYKCPWTLHELYERLKKTLEHINKNFEIIMVDDGSPLNDWEIITALAKKDTRVKGIKLSRNFGQHYAITAGLDFAKGSWVVVMDCDLQDKPEEILKLYNKAMEGYDIVVGIRARRKDGFFKKMSSKIFWKMYSYFTDTKIDGRIGNFGIYSQKVITSILNMKEHTRSFGLFALWVGFKRVEIEIDHSQRKAGNSSYTLTKLINLTLDAILSHSQKPLILFIKLGFIISFISFIFAIFLIVQHYMLAIPVAGWTSIMVSIYFLSGIIITCIGIVGIYIGKVYNEVKNRPLYIIESVTFK
ncbi:MAG: glycosyltransferase family 2 protein [Spirochaetota bacterium]